MCFFVFKAQPLQSVAPIDKTTDLVNTTSTQQTLKETEFALQNTPEKESIPSVSKRIEMKWKKTKNRQMERKRSFGGRRTKKVRKLRYTDTDSSYDSGTEENESESEKEESETETENKDTDTDDDDSYINWLRTRRRDRERRVRRRREREEKQRRKLKNRRKHRSRKRPEIAEEKNMTHVCQVCSHQYRENTGDCDSS